MDAAKLVSASPDVVQTIDGVQNEAKKNALRTVVIFPVFMLVSYLGLFLYFKSRGGYKPVVLEKDEALPMAEY